MTAIIRIYSEYCRGNISRTDYEAEVIGRDLVRDIAVIKIDAEDLPYLEMGDPVEIDLGEDVVVLGVSAI